MNAVHAFLDALAIPWRASMAELTAQVGIAKHPVYGWDVILLDHGPVNFPAAIYPIHTNAFSVTSDCPSDYFSTHIWVTDDPLENLRVAETFVSGFLGPASEVTGDSASDYTREWKQGPAAIKLNAVRDDLRSYPGSNPAHERDVRLKTACAVNLYPGYRPQLSEKERIWVASARPVLPLQGENLASNLETLNAARPSVVEVHFARDPTPECERLLGTISLSGDGEALVVCGEKLLIVPVTRVLRVEVDKLYPARGSGGSRAKLHYSNPHSEGGENWIDVSNGRHPDELDEFATRLGALIARPVILNDAYPDS